MGRLRFPFATARSSRADGAFRLEGPHAGPVKLVPTDGKTTEADAVSLNLGLGQHVRDVTLHSR